MGWMKSWRTRYGGLTLRLLWDLFMVWVAIINLSLIVFDLTYLLLRPTYYRYAPVVTRVWDPVLGIEPHPLTSRLAADADAAASLLALDPTSERLQEHLAELRRLTARVLVENPFERSGQSRQLEIIRGVVAVETDRAISDLRDPDTARAAAAELWSGPPELLRHRFDLFSRRIEPGLAVNYERSFDVTGRLTNHFWLIDLPFLLLFWVEFVVRWALAVHRRSHARWYFFPIFNWYDALGLIPVAAFRPFRLLRLVSMYMRLRSSELTSIGKDAVSRAVAWISNVITEEVSDRVAIRILDEYAEEIVDGTHVRIARSVVVPRRQEIAHVLAEQIGALLTDAVTLERLRELLRLNLEQALADSPALQAVPLPNAVVRPLVRAAGEVMLDTTLSTVRTTLDSEDGRRAVEAVAAAALERVMAGPWLGEVESLARNISLQVIGHMRDTVAVKKWALPDDQRRATTLAEALDEFVETTVGDDAPAEDP